MSEVKPIEGKCPDCGKFLTMGCYQFSKDVANFEFPCSECGYVFSIKVPWTDFVEIAWKDEQSRQLYKEIKGKGNASSEVKHPKLCLF